MVTSSSSYWLLHIHSLSDHSFLSFYFGMLGEGRETELLLLLFRTNKSVGHFTSKLPEFSMSFSSFFLSSVVLWGSFRGELQEVSLLLLLNTQLSALVALLYHKRTSPSLPPGYPFPLFPLLGVMQRRLIKHLPVWDDISPGNVYFSKIYRRSNDLSISFLSLIYKLFVNSKWTRIVKRQACFLSSFCTWTIISTRFPSLILFFIPFTSSIRPFLIAMGLTPSFVLSPSIPCLFRNSISSFPSETLLSLSQDLLFPHLC